MSEPTFSTVQDQERRRHTDTCRKLNEALAEVARWKNRAESAEAILRRLAEVVGAPWAGAETIHLLNEHKEDFPEAWH